MKRDTGLNCKGDKSPRRCNDSLQPGLTPPSSSISVLRESCGCVSYNTLFAAGFNFVPESYDRRAYTRKGYELLVGLRFFVHPRQLHVFSRSLSQGGLKRRLGSEGVIWNIST